MTTCAGVPRMLSEHEDRLAFFRKESLAEPVSASSVSTSGSETTLEPFGLALIRLTNNRSIIPSRYSMRIQPAAFVQRQEIRFGGLCHCSRFWRHGVSHRGLVEPLQQAPIRCIQGESTSPSIATASDLHTKLWATETANPVLKEILHDYAPVPGTKASYTSHKSETVDVFPCITYGVRSNRPAVRRT